MAEEILLDIERLKKKISHVTKSKHLKNIFNQLYELVDSIHNNIEETKMIEEKMCSLGIKKESLNEIVKPQINIIKSKPLTPITVRDSKLKLFTITAKNQSEIKSNGQLYYIPNEDKFAFKLNGHIIKGNVGQILKKSDPLVKIKDCRNYNDCKNASCTYIHNNDIRNYVEQNFVYKSSTLLYNESFTKFGSCENLDVDFLNLDKNAKKRIIDMYIHCFINCLLLLEN